MSPTMPTPTDLTRQQLDELDALLQRMLNLPLNSPPPEPAPIPPAPSITVPTGWRADPPSAPKPPQAPHAAETDEDAFAPALAVSLGVTMPAPSAPPLATMPAPTPAPTPAFLPEPPSAGPLRGVDAPALPTHYVAPAPPETAAAPPPVDIQYEDVVPVALAPAPEAVPAAAPSPEAVPLWLWPLFAINWMMELVLGLLGPLGAVITAPAVKHLLGVTGLGLLAAAAAWSARGMGWVSW